MGCVVVGLFGYFESQVKLVHGFTHTMLKRTHFVPQLSILDGPSSPSRLATLSPTRMLFTSFR